MLKSGDQLFLLALADCMAVFGMYNIYLYIHVHIQCNFLFQLQYQRFKSFYSQQCNFIFKAFYLH